MDRKLATIFASDVVGFSKMMGTDEVNTLNILKQRREVIDSIIDDHDGIIFGCTKKYCPPDRYKEPKCLEYE